MKPLQELQSLLSSYDIDGWLLYDYEGANHIAIQFLELPEGAFLTRRFAYWIPKNGSPVRIVHPFEATYLEHVPGKEVLYRSSHEFVEALRETLPSSGKVAMEYSPYCGIPNISLVDGGTIDLIRSFGVDVVSSQNISQAAVCVLSDEQFASHKEAAKVIDEALHRAWTRIEESLEAMHPITEYDVQQEILSHFRKRGCVTQGSPIVAVNENGSDPHYMPHKDHSRRIQYGDCVMIDLWCKKKKHASIFADVTQMGIAAEKATVSQQEVFDAVRSAQQSAIDLLMQRYESGTPVFGYELDVAARETLEEKGFAQHFVHRLGHNIHCNDHGPGANLDSLESKDERELIRGTLFSIEPGVYIEGEIGVRLECNVYIPLEGMPIVTTPLQDGYRLLPS